ncbi:MAG: hypothetical protein ACOY37_05525 [Pseudomonadota bacterium]
MLSTAIRAQELEDWTTTLSAVNPRKKARNVMDDRFTGGDGLRPGSFAHQLRLGLMANELSGAGAGPTGWRGVDPDSSPRSLFPNSTAKGLASMPADAGPGSARSRSHAPA